MEPLDSDTSSSDTEDGSCALPTPYTGGRPPKTGENPRDFTAQEMSFISNYLAEGMDGTKAAILAGYRPDRAKYIAHNLLTRPHIKYEIARQFNILYGDGLTDIKGLRVLAELSSIGFSDVGEVFDDNGNLLPIKQLPSHVRRSISCIKVTKRRVLTTNEVIEDEYISEVKFWDKNKALSTLATCYGLNRTIVELTGPNGGPVQLQQVPSRLSELSPEAKRKIISILDGELSMLNRSPTLARPPIDSVINSAINVTPTESVPTSTPEDVPSRMCRPYMLGFMPNEFCLDVDG